MNRLACLAMLTVLPFLVRCAAKPTTSPVQAAPASNEAASLATLPPLPSEPSSQPASIPVLKVDPKIQRRYDDAVAIAKQSPTKAVQMLDEVTGDEPKFCSAWFNAGVLLERAHDDAKAIEHYRNALSHDSHCSVAAQALILIDLRAGKIADAELELRRTLANNPDDLGLRNRLLQIQLARGQYLEVEKGALAILKVDEKNATAMLSLSRAFYFTHKYELARLAVDNAKEITPDSGEIYHQLGMLLLQQNERSKALVAFRRAVELDPQLAPSQLNLSQLLTEAGDFEGALAAVQAAIAAEPNSLMGHLMLGNALRGVQRFTEAEAEYNRVLTMDPANNDAVYNLAVLYLDAELPGIELEARLQKSLQYFQRYLRKAPADEQAAVNNMMLQATRQIDGERKRKERDEKRRAKDAAKQAAAATQPAGSGHISPSSQPATPAPNSPPVKPTPASKPPKGSAPH